MGKKHIYMPRIVSKLCPRSSPPPGRRHLKSASVHVSKATPFLIVSTLDTPLSDAVCLHTRPTPTSGSSDPVSTVCCSQRCPMASVHIHLLSPVEIRTRFPGIFFLLTIQATVALTRRQRHCAQMAHHRRTLLGYVCITFILATIGFAGNARYTEMIWIDLRDAPGGPAALIQDELSYRINVMALTWYVLCRVAGMTTKSRALVTTSWNGSCKHCWFVFFPSSCLSFPFTHDSSTVALYSGAGRNASSSPCPYSMQPWSVRTHLPPPPNTPA